MVVFSLTRPFGPIMNYLFLNTVFTDDTELSIRISVGDLISRLEKENPNEFIESYVYVIDMTDETVITAISDKSIQIEISRAGLVIDGIIQDPVNSQLAISADREEERFSRNNLEFI